MDRAGLDRLRLARTEGVGPQTYRRLVEQFGSAGEALHHLPGKFNAPAPAAIEREAAAVTKLGGRFLFLGTAEYPPLLETLSDPPPAIAVLGDPATLSRRAVALVGARNASANGRRIAEDLAEALAAAGVTVVSGLARGIDAAAHIGALRPRVDGQAGAASTIAAVAGGLDLPYPPENAKLQARIAAEGGAVVAEAPLGTAPLARHFPRRNRIVAALALGVVVVEAAPRSGSLITARLALEAGREVFAVPGSPLDPRARGGNDLIRQGAHLVESAADVLANLPETLPDAPLFEPALHWGAADPGPEEAPPPPGASAQVLDLLGPTPIAVDEVMRRCHLSPSAVQAILLDLEMDGRVQMLPGNRVALTRGA